jgi:hypothetical protein
MFIIENRQYADLNSYLPDWRQTSGLGGIVFWEWYGLTSEYRTIKPGDNDFDISPPGGNPYWTGGDGGDPFPGLSDKRLITMGTAPNTSNHNGDPTGFAITNISTSGVNMTVNFVKCLLNSSTAEATSFNNSRKIIRDSGGAYHLVFENGGEIIYQKSTDGGLSWNAFKRLSTGNGNNKYPSITERAGHIYVVWQRTTDTNQYAILFRHSGNSGSSWDGLRTITSNLSQNSDPLPVLTTSTPAASFEMLVAYRTASGIKSRRSTSTTGASWASEMTVTSNTSARNPSLIYKSNDYGYFNLTWDNGNQIYHQKFYGSS